MNPSHIATPPQPVDYDTAVYNSAQKTKRAITESQVGVDYFKHFTFKPNISE